VLLVLAIVMGLLPGFAYAEKRESHVDDMRVALSAPPAFGSKAMPLRSEASTVDIAPFQMIGASWSGSDGVQVRVHAASGWQTWKTLERDADEGPDTPPTRADTRTPSAPVWVGVADGYEVNAPADVTDVVMHLVRETTSRQIVTQGVQPAGAIVGTAGDPPPVVTRQEWGARDATTSPSYASALRNAIVHHTVSSNDYAPEAVPSILRGIQAYHMDANGWSDIGYNFLVDRYGRIWEGRGGGIDKPVIGAHSAGFNTGSTGIAVIGDFRSVSPTAASVEAVATIAGWKLANAGTDPTGFVYQTSLSTENPKYAYGETAFLPAISGHRDSYSTECPGPALYALLPAIRDRAAQLYPYIFGSFDSVARAPGGVRVNGWAVARSTPDPISVLVTVDGVATAQFTANQSRPDVGAALPDFGSAHGVSQIVPVASGAHLVCMYGLNNGSGSTYGIGCKNVALVSNPAGHLDFARLAPGGVHVGGWALDPDGPGPIAVDIYVNGAIVQRLGANTPRPDVGAVAPDWGDDHGFDATVRAPMGDDVVCAYAINYGPGTANPLLGCGRVAVTSNPIGAVDGVTSTTVRGWTIDPDVTAPIAVHVYVNGQYLKAATAVATRDDVGAVFPEYGSSHGYSIAFGSTLPTNTTVCVFAINSGPGTTNPMLGCLRV
jgi:hypothetical protein